TPPTSPPPHPPSSRPPPCVAPTSPPLPQPVARGASRGLPAVSLSCPAAASRRSGASGPRSAPPQSSRPGCAPTRAPAGFSPAPASPRLRPCWPPPPTKPPAALTPAPDIPLAAPPSQANLSPTPATLRHAIRPYPKHRPSGPNLKITSTSDSWHSWVGRIFGGDE